MTSFVVTLKSNIVLDDEGDFQLDEDENFVLKDNDDVGILIKTHVIPMSQLTKDGAVMSGYVSRAEVYWDKRHNPAPDMVDPSDLVWLYVAEEADEEDDEGEEIEDEQEEHEVHELDSDQVEFEQ